MARQNHGPHICSFHDGFFEAKSPSGKQGVLFEDSDQFGPSKVSPRTGDPVDFISERLRWFWDWYPRWREAGRPHVSKRSVPFGEIGVCSVEVPAP